MDELYCFGCGIKLQDQDENKDGYVHPNALKRDIILCQRCFKLQHYGKLKEAKVVDEPLKLIANDAKENDVIVLVIDSLLINCPITFDLTNLKKYKSIFVVASRYDLYKSFISKDKIYEFLDNYFKKTNLNIIDIFIIDNNIDYIFDKLDNYSIGKNVYIIGQENAGKTTFINEILKNIANEKTNFLTNSKYPGTTLDLVKINLTDTTYLVDSPGIKSKGNIINFLDFKLIKKINSDKKIQASTYQLSNLQTIFVSSFIKIDISCKYKQGFTFYFPSCLKLNRYKTINALESIKNEITYLKVKDENIDYDKLKSKVFILDNKSYYDIIIEGLGFIRAKNSKIVISTYDGVNIFKRKSII